VARHVAILEILDNKRRPSGAAHHSTSYVSVCQRELGDTVEDRSAAGAAIEKHFTVDEIAELWGLSRDSVIRLFEGEPGTVVVQTPKGNRGRRGYRTLRIPTSVMCRVHRRMSIAA
jgi:hypothetical protein